MEYISLRMVRKSSRRDQYYRKGPFIIDLKERRIQFHRREIHLIPGTFDYLVTLIKHAPNPVTYQTLVSESLGYQLPRLDAQDLARWRVHALRQAIEANPNRPRWIKTVAGTGYRFTI